MHLSRGLIFAEFTIAPNISTEFGGWHSGEHIAERLPLPGYGSVQRFVSEQDELRFVCLYRAESVETFSSAAYRAVIANPSALTKRMLEGVVGTRFVGEVVRDIGAGFAGRLCRLRIEVLPERDDDVLAWFDAEAPRLLGEPGTTRLILAKPSRAYDLTTDPHWICLIEGCWNGPAVIDHRFDAKIGTCSSLFSRLQQMFPNGAH